VKKYYSRESKVIFPPVQTNTYKNEQAGDYFLAVSRLFPEKRMSLIARAFAGMPSEKLVVVGDGPEREAIEKLVEQNSSITLLSNVPEHELIKLYANCRATVYMPIDEDYGLVPLEGMAAGKPCIAANEGGCKETIRDGKTGFLVDPDINSIQVAVGRMSREWVISHAEECRQQAQKFDLSHCVTAWKKLLDEEWCMVQSGPNGQGGPS
jgi:glycosyltransferase involved in cell wall biosynthesis